MLEVGPSAKMLRSGGTFERWDLVEMIDSDLAE